MLKNYLGFEEPIKEIEEKIKACEELEEKTGVTANDAKEQLYTQLKEAKEELYTSLSIWQKIELSRHPDRPYTLEYIEQLTDGYFLELHGDRGSKDDKAMIAALGRIEQQPFMMLGQQKGVNTKMRRIRNFGMASPQGYRKALRMMKMAEKFQIPILTFIDTPGAYADIEAERYGQGEAIARNIYEMFNIRVPIIVVVIGEGASGGALGIGVGDRIFMMEYTWYSVISPESCSSILWRSWDHKEQAAESLQLLPENLQRFKVIDSIMREPLGGAQNDRQQMYTTMKKSILDAYHTLRALPTDTLIEQRRQKYFDMGEYVER